jgi:hypothetical protein
MVDLASLPPADDGGPDVRFLVGTPRGSGPLFLHCPVHGDEGRPNLAVYPNGTYCFACGFRETREQFVARLSGQGQIEVVEASPPRFDPVPPFSWAGVVIWHRTLTEGPMRHRIGWYLERGLSPETIERFRLGHTGARFAIPVWFEGACTGVQFRVDPLYSDPDEPKYRAPSGTKTLLCRPYPSGHPTVVCEGPLDAYLLAQFGVDAVTTTGGAGSLTEVLKLALRDPVVVMTDLDDAGDDAWERLRSKRPGWVRAIWNGGKDVSEALARVDSTERASVLFEWLREAISTCGFGSFDRATRPGGSRRAGERG